MILQGRTDIFLFSHTHNKRLPTDTHGNKRLTTDARGDKRLIANAPNKRRPTIKINLATSSTQRSSTTLTSP